MRDRRLGSDKTAVDPWCRLPKTKVRATSPTAQAAAMARITLGQYPFAGTMSAAASICRATGCRPTFVPSSPVETRSRRPIPICCVASRPLRAASHRARSMRVAVEEVERVLTHDDPEVVLGLCEETFRIDELEPVRRLERVPLVDVTVDEDARSSRAPRCDVLHRRARVRRRVPTRPIRAPPRCGDELGEPAALLGAGRQTQPAAGRQTRVAVEQRISCRSRVGSASSWSDRPSRSSRSAPRLVVSQQPRASFAAVRRITAISSGAASPLRGRGASVPRARRLARHASATNASVASRNGAPTAIRHSCSRLRRAPAIRRATPRRRTHRLPPHDLADSVRDFPDVPGRIHESTRSSIPQGRSIGPFSNVTPRCGQLGAHRIDVVDLEGELHAGSGVASLPPPQARSAPAPR